MGSHTDHSQHSLGLISGVICYTLWGFFPLYFILLREVPADEILMDRILFAVPFGAVIIWARSQWNEVWAGFGSPRVLMWLLLSAGFIALNWLVYIAAVQSGNTMQASLGYYINPLIYVLVGVVVLGERLRRAQIAAVILATIGVLVLTFYGGQFPVISLTLAISFTVYGYSRKKVAIGAMPGLFIETVMLAPFAAGWLIWLFATKETGMERGLTEDPALVFWLLMAGPLTVIPLLFFALAARRLPLATLGFLQFIGPTLQFLVALADGEPFTRAHQICFGLIWIAVAIFMFDAVRQRPSKRADKPVMQVTAAQSSE